MVFRVGAKRGLEGVTAWVFVDARWRSCVDSVTSRAARVSISCKCSYLCFELTVGFLAAFSGFLDKFAVRWKVSVLGALALAAVQTDSSILTDAFKLTSVGPNLALVVLLSLVDAYFVAVQISNLLASVGCVCWAELTDRLKATYSWFLDKSTGGGQIDVSRAFVVAVVFSIGGIGTFALVSTAVVPFSSLIVGFTIVEALTIVAGLNGRNAVTAELAAVCLCPVLEFSNARCGVVLVAVLQDIFTWGRNLWRGCGTEPTGQLAVVLCPVCVVGAGVGTVLVAVSDGVLAWVGLSDGLLCGHVCWQGWGNGCACLLLEGTLDGGKLAEVIRQHNVGAVWVRCHLFQFRL